MHQETVQLIITAAIVAVCAVYVLRKLFFKKTHEAGKPPHCAGDCGRCGGCH